MCTMGRGSGRATERKEPFHSFIVLVFSCCFGPPILRTSRPRERALAFFCAKSLLVVVVCSLAQAMNVRIYACSPMKTAVRVARG